MVRMHWKFPLNDCRNIPVTSNMKRIITQTPLVESQMSIQGRVWRDFYPQGSAWGFYCQRERNFRMTCWMIV